MRMPKRWLRKGSGVRWIRMKRMPETVLDPVSEALVEMKRRTYRASRLAATIVLCTTQIAPKSSKDAAGSEEQSGCRAMVNVMAIPQANIHVVTETRKKWVAIFCVRSLLVMIFSGALPDPARATPIWTPRYTTDNIPLLSSVLKHIGGCTIVSYLHSRVASSPRSAHLLQCRC